MPKKSDSPKQKERKPRKARKHEIINPYPLKIFSNFHNTELAANIAKRLKVKGGLGKTFYQEFSEGELLTHQNETVRDCDVVLICQIEMLPEKIYRQIFESLALIRAVRKGTPFKIRVIYPLIPFSRQDRASKQREASTFKMFCDLIYTAGADEIYTLHLHSLATAEFFGQIGSNAKMENATLNDFFLQLMLKHLPGIKKGKYKMGAPDISAGKSARGLAKRLGWGTVIVDKEREPNKTLSTVREVIGDPKGFDIVFFDDMIATAGSCVNASEAVRAMGAKKTYMIAPHLVYSKTTWENLKLAGFEQIWITDTCVIPREKLLKNMRVFSVAKLIARIIDNAHNGKSVSDIWNNGAI